LDHEDRLFHFKLPSSNVIEENDEIQHPHRRHRIKRHVESKLDLLRGDDRVDYALPQIYVKRHKRSSRYLDDGLEQDELESLLNSLNNYETNRLRVMRKKLFNDFFLAESEENTNEKSSQIFQLPSDIDFNDQEYKKQWYLINDGQFNIPKWHDLNVKNAWLNGYTGRNVSIVIVDDGLDHEHPDFAGKYVI
jgi:hypothetical protein